MKAISLTGWFAFVLLAQTVCGQVPDSVSIRFRLEVEPQVSSLGLNDPNATWKLSYKLRIADQPVLGQSLIGVRTVEKGKVRRKSLMFAGNRTIIRQVLFDKSTLKRLSSSGSQTFFLEVKWKLCSRALKTQLRGVRNKSGCASMKVTFDFRADSIKLLPNQVFGVRMGITDDFSRFTYVDISD